MFTVLSSTASNFVLVSPNGQPSMIEIIDNKVTVPDGDTIVCHEQKLNSRVELGVESNSQSKIPDHYLVNYSDSDSEEEGANANDLDGKLLKE